MIKLGSKKVSITLVETMNNYEAIQATVMSDMAAAFGGATAVAQEGAWMGNDGNMVVEKGVNISAYVKTDPNADSHIAWLAGFVFKMAGNQDAVLFTLSDGTACLETGDN